jgi:glutathione peroxidase
MTSADATIYRSYRVFEVKSAEPARCSFVTFSGYFRWGSLASALFASALLAVPGHGLQPTVNAADKGQGAHAAGKKGSTAPDAEKAKGDKAEKNAYDFTLPGADGKDVPVSSFKGKYILIVNLGRKSTYGEQLGALIKLNDEYKDKGLVVIGVPSNQFGLAEPGTSAEIQKAYVDAKVDFPVMAVSKITGDDELPLYGYLTKSKSAPAGGPVHWNYTKFIIDTKGNVLARLDPDVTPDSAEMKSTIEKVLAGTYKPKKADGKPGAKPADDDDDDD